MVSERTNPARFRPQPLDRVLASLREIGRPPRRSGAQWAAACPAHDDRTPSLAITAGSDGRALLYCRAGCPTEAVVGALGLTMADLFEGVAPQAHAGPGSPGASVPAEPTREVGRKAWRICDTQGRHVATHGRVDLVGERTGRRSKRLWWAQPDGSGGLPEGLRSADLPLYGAELLASKVGKPLVLVEGEKAADALRAHKVLALGTVTGASGTPGAESLEALRERRVVLWPDNDDPGRAHMDRIGAALTGVAADVRLVRWAEAPPKGDAADFQGDRAALGALLKGAETWTPPASEPPTPPSVASDASVAPDTDTGMPSVPDAAPWPASPGADVYRGLAGDFVRLMEPQSEADPVALLLNFLVMFGNMIGRGAHAMAERTRHACNLFAVLVGETALGRKGTSQRPAQELMRLVDPEWEGARLAPGGLSSGEGLIWEIRDPIRKWDPTKQVERVEDNGIGDKRLLVVEAEYAQACKVMAREGNTLSPVLRSAWDGGNLRTMTKNSPARVSEPHVSILGHVTKGELLRHLGEAEYGNGFANRFLWVCVRRSKCLPEGGLWPAEALLALAERVRKAADFAQRVGEVRRDGAARALWAAEYLRLTSPPPGLLGSMVARAAPQVLRLSVLYALLDCSPVVTVEHLRSALALWDYCERSARFIFGKALGDPTADRILELLAPAPAGLTRTELRDAFGRHKPQDLARALGVLLAAERVTRTMEPTDGRHCERWHLATKATKATEGGAQQVASVASDASVAAQAPPSAPEAPPRACGHANAWDVWQEDECPACRAAQLARRQSGDAAQPEAITPATNCGPTQPACTDCPPQGEGGA